MIAAKIAATNAAPRLLLAVLLAVLLLAGALGCLTTYNRPKFTLQDGAPAVEARADGCHVDVFQDGDTVPRPHADLGVAVLDWPQKKIEEQGPEGAIKTLKIFACESGAFIIKDLRALTMGVGEGMIYEATFATLLGDDGKPLNAKVAPAAEGASDAGPGGVGPGDSGAGDATPAPSPSASDG